MILASTSFAQDLDVGLYRGKKISRIVFSYHQGSYNVYGDTAKLWTILPNESIELRYRSEGVQVLHGAEELGFYKSVRLEQNNTNSSVRIKSTSPSLKERKQQDNFAIRKYKSGLQIVNHVSMANYLAGVIESEGGAHKPLEYYKVQAVLSRTYISRNKKRHKKEGFLVCDDVHCQAYHNMLRYTPEIRDAIRETKGEVVVDSFGRMTEGFFHANCGGQTSPSEFVWNQKINYLKSVVDTFCIYTRQATWTKKIPKGTWRHFLVNQYNFPEKDSLYAPLLYHFDQPMRKAFYHSSQLGIPLRDLRKKFKLKSTFFSCSLEGDNVVLKGRGYGHAVGMCQEGTMKMARAGLTYEQIIKYYFTGVQIINQNKVLTIEEDPIDIESLGID
jgi:stage II sporulation protein D